MNLPEKLAFVDIETTGTSFGRDRIIEIGILRVENNQLTSEYQSLIKPDTYLSPYIEAITGIKSHDLETAPSFESLKEDILQMLEDCVFVSHNVSFDYGFLKSEFSRLGIPFNFKKFCTVKLSRRLFPTQPRHNLDSVIETHNIVCENRHRAYDDAAVLWKFYQKLQTQFDEETLASAIWGALKRPTYPIAIPQEKLDALPEGPGVYIFYAENGMPLYVGKSVNIRSRVLSHFCDVTSSREIAMCKQTIHIDTIPTAGELGALIREAQLIKSMLPIYNRALRRNRRMLVLLREQTENYTKAVLVQAEKLTAADTDNVLAIFKSKRQAENYIHTLAKEHQLCPKLLGLEKTNGKCSFQQFGWCKGACIMSETAVAYNTRLIEAFDKDRILPWPFQGAIHIREHSEVNNLEEEILFRQWCHVELDDDTSPENIVFDRDIYKILRRYLRSPKNIKNVAMRM
jgi:DNA polymerase III subunit epsilon